MMKSSIMKYFCLILFATVYVGAMVSGTPNSVDNEPIDRRENLASLNHNLLNHSDTSAMKCSKTAKKARRVKQAAKKMVAQTEPTSKKGGAAKIYKLDTTVNQRID
jgi:hypothetical protein